MDSCNEINNDQFTVDTMEVNDSSKDYCKAITDKHFHNLSIQQAIF